MQHARWDRYILARLAMEIWLEDLRPELAKVISGVDGTGILRNEECRPGGDFPSERTAVETEARNRLRQLVPFYNEQHGTMTAVDWETIANMERVVFTPGEPLDLDFIVRLGAALRAKAKTAAEACSEGNTDPRTAHSIDFASANWFGTLYEFTPAQAACVKVLWEAWEHGTPIIGEATIINETDGNSALRALFQGNRAWGN